MSAILDGSYTELTFFFLLSYFFCNKFCQKHTLIVCITLTDLAELQTEMTADAVLSLQKWKFHKYCS